MAAKKRARKAQTEEAREEATPGTEPFSTRVSSEVLKRLYRYKGEDRKNRKIQDITTAALDAYLNERGS